MALPWSSRRWRIDSIRNRYAPLNWPSTCCDTVPHKIGTTDNCIGQLPFFLLALAPGIEETVIGFVLPTGECLPLLGKQPCFDDPRCYGLSHHSPMPSRSSESEDFQSSRIEREHCACFTPVAPTNEVAKCTIGPKKYGRHRGA